MIQLLHRKVRYSALIHRKLPIAIEKMPRQKPISPVAQETVAFARAGHCLPELCLLVDYDPDIRRAPKYWKPRTEVLELAAHLSFLPSNSLPSGE